MEVVSPGSVAIELFFLFLLIGVNAYFAVMEISVVGSRPSRIDQMAGEGSRGARIVQGWLENDNSRSRFIATAQLGVTFASLALGVVGEGAVDDIMQGLFGGVQATGVFASVMEALPLVLSLLIVSSLHLIFGEQVPKVSALLAPERTATALAWPMKLFGGVFSPMIGMLNAAAGFVLRRLGLKSEGEQSTVYTVDELRQILRESEASGVLGQEEHELIDSVFDIHNLLAGQVMVPRTEMCMLGADTGLHAIVEAMTDMRYTKCPVYDEGPDDIIGVLSVKAVMQALVGIENEKIAARDLCSKALFVPESLPLPKLLDLFREKGESMAIVYDEFGGTDGLVTLDDVLNWLIGELPGRRDEEPAGAAEVIRYGDDYLISGLMSLEVFNEWFDLDLSDRNYNTIGGYVMGRLDRVPRAGDAVQIEGMRLYVEAMDALRIDRLRVELAMPGANDGAAATRADT
ncbi:MAG: HlyC/CorC family transporter [Anaerolineae bacterium]|nr:HlyC/CorC family transporter [Anaerolineae bacterium]